MLNAQYLYLLCTIQPLHVQIKMLNSIYYYYYYFGDTHSRTVRRTL